MMTALWVYLAITAVAFLWALTGYGAICSESPYVTGYAYWSGQRTKWARLVVRSPLWPVWVVFGIVVSPIRLFVSIRDDLQGRGDS